MSWESNGQVSPLHPGEVLREEFLGGLEAITAIFREPASSVLLTSKRVSPLIRHCVFAEARGTTPEFRLNPQTRCEVEIAKPKIEEDLETSKRS